MRHEIRIERRTKPCVRCGLIAEVDRAGYCKLCQYEQAFGKVYINWKLFSANWHARGWTW